VKRLTKKQIEVFRAAEQIDKKQRNGIGRHDFLIALADLALEALEKERIHYDREGE
jgi:hypothetical protein